MRLHVFLRLLSLEDSTPVPNLLYYQTISDSVTDPPPFRMPINVAVRISLLLYNLAFVSLIGCCTSKVDDWCIVAGPC